MTLKVKVCGLKSSENLKQVAALGVDYVGMIFYPKSPRFVNENPNNFNELSIPKVGVFVNPSMEEIINAKNHYGISIVQLHGNENPEFCLNVKKLDLEVWKAFGINESFDFSILSKYSSVNLFLFDTKTPIHGGSGIKFSWNLLNKVPTQFSYFLSGGIDIEDVQEIKNLKLSGLVGIDINSKFEVEPGIKNLQKISNFLSLIRT